MDKLLLGFIAFCCATVSLAQSDPALTSRLNSFMEANSRMDLEKVLDYTYPKLFTIAPRDQMLEVLKKTFDNDLMTIQLDSPQIVKVYPVFQMQQGRYAKILYAMKMIMHFKNKDADPDKIKEQNEKMLSGMKSKYGDKKVSMDSSGNILIRMSAVMVAVKDASAKEWCFVNLKENDPLTSRLFTKEITDKLSTYK